MTELITVSTFTACQTIKRAATIQGDEAMLYHLLGVDDDLTAAEVKYHKNCYSLYTAKKVRDDKGESGNESHHENAFKQLEEELRPRLETRRASPCHADRDLFGRLLVITGIGKERPWNVFIQSEVHRESLTILGQQPEIDEETAKKCEAFICNLYPSYKKSPKTSDELRYIIFCRKKPNSEALPPTSDSFFSSSRHC